MKEWIYQIKGKRLDSGFSNWGWPPIFSGKVEAPDRATAKALVEAEYGRTFPTRVLQKDLESNEFLLSIKEIAANDHYTRRQFEVATCKQCGQQFKLIEKYALDNPGGGFDYCSRECSDAYRALHGEYVNREGGHPPVIYKITNRQTGMCYIGKTRQAFTLRWYQHFFQGSNTKFHTAIRNTPISDWTFEVLEIVVLPAGLKDVVEIERVICERERHYIVAFNSIENGYNTQGPVAGEPGLFDTEEAA